jgi:uncharacterized protein YnzC (UPF0291/DUF896 family)
VEDLKELARVVAERAETLAAIRLQKVDWTTASELSLQELVRSAYLDGARDAMDYLAMVLEGEAEA